MLGKKHRQTQCMPHNALYILLGKTHKSQQLGSISFLVTYHFSPAVHVCVCTQLCLTLCHLLDCSPPGSSVHGIPGKNTGLGCHFLLQGIFPTQESNPRLLSPLHCQVDSLPPSHVGSTTCPQVLTKKVSCHFL